MRSYRSLDEYLPLKFQNQSTIVRFYKKCPNCGSTVEASNMHGEVLVVNDVAIIAALAKCQKCADKFSVSCLINNQKQVRQLIVPMSFLRWWLYKNRQKYLSDLPLNWHISLSKGRVTAIPAPDSEMKIAPTPQQEPSPDLISEEIVGSLGELQIHSWIIFDGKRYDFDRILLEGANISKDEELVFKDKLVYSRKKI